MRMRVSFRQWALISVLVAKPSCGSTSPRRARGWLKRWSGFRRLSPICNSAPRPDLPAQKNGPVSSTGPFPFCHSVWRLLVVVDLERRAKDIAKRCTGVGRAILLNRLFFFGDLAGLDRQTQTAGLALHVGHADIDLVADREALGALLGTVTAEVGAADEGFHALVFHLDAAILDRRHFDGDDRAALHATHGIGELVPAEGLDGERDTLFLDIHLGDDSLNHIAFLVALDRFLATLVPAQIAEVNHAVDFAFETDEQTEFGDVLDLALDFGAGGVGLGKDFPRVAHGLLETKADTTLGAVDFQNHDFDLLRGGDDLAGMHVLLGPGHLRDVNETFDTGLQLNEGTVVGDVRHAAGMHRIERVLGGDQIPRIFLQLLHAEADAMRVLVDLDDLNLDGLADREDFRGVIDAAPGHVGDVQKAVDTAEIHEGPVFGDVLDHTIDRLARGEVGDDLGALFGAAFFQDGAARHDDIAAAAIHLEDLQGLLETHERACVAHRAHIDLRAGQEGHGTAEIDSKATLDATEDCAFDALFVGIGLLQTVPCLFAAGHLAADHGFATGVLGGAQIDFDLVADFYLGLLAGICEFLEIDAAFHFVADVDDGLARFDRDHLAFDDRPFFGCVHFEAFFKKGFELLHRCVLSHVACCS